VPEVKKDGGERMNIRPLADRVVIQVSAAEEVSKGGIVIPDTAKEKPQQGVVVAIGRGKTEGTTLIVPEVAVGDKVLFMKYSGAEITIEEKEYLILREEDILAVI
jgi:chaperonin GroES